MYFKNAIIYPYRNSVTVDQVEASLATRRFVECGPHDAFSVGWTPSFGDQLFAHSVGGAILISLKRQTKIVPGPVVQQHAHKKARVIEAQQGFKPGRKQMKEIKEAVLQELLPRALTRDVITTAYIDTARKILVINTGSVRVADDVITALFACELDLGIRRLKWDRSPSSFMVDLLVNQGEGQFSVDRDCDLRAVADGGEIKYRHHPLDDGPVGHIESGKVPIALAVTFDDRISFVLTEAGHMKRIGFVDVLKEEANKAETADDVFNSELSITSGEIGRVFETLSQELREGIGCEQ
ncbi:MAG: recombination-associated protein RdgC [Proteobacteria bacterium]|nr:recombination-associated protein RdgC [Pseudomonadota bacterium]